MPSNHLHTEPYEPMRALREFHAAFDVPRFIEQDKQGRAQTLRLRARLIAEEACEVDAEIIAALEGDGDYEGMAKELADLLYVVYGTADALDIPLEAVFQEVHRSNMSKLGEDGKPIYREDGKVLKGPNYRPADVRRALFGPLA